MSLYKRKETIVEAVRLDVDVSVDEARWWVIERGGSAWIKGREPALMILDAGDDNTIARKGYYILFEDYCFYIMQPEKFNRLYTPLE